MQGWFCSDARTASHQLLEGGGAQLVPEQSGQFPHKVSSRACSMDPTNPGLGTPHAQGQTIGDNGH